MKLISWNVNGLRACIQKGFLDFFQQADADFFCLQETKLSEGQIDLSLPGYHQYWCYAEKKGYSGTAIFAKHTPLSVTYGIGADELDNEGRVITLEYPEFYLVNCYTPNAQRGLARLDHRMKWDEAYRAYIVKLDAVKPVILCGDLNVAHKDIDLKNPSSNRQSAGFSLEERESFSKTLSLGFTDTFRHLHPDITGVYTWWSYMYHARENNAGWRIDYFLVSDRVRDRIYSTPIYSDVLGSDHCPVGLELDISCNGSIWHEKMQGQAQLVVDPNKSKSIAFKVISSILAVALLLGAGVFAAKLFPEPYEKFLTVYSYDKPLEEVYTATPSLSSIYSKSITDGNTVWRISYIYGGLLDLYTSYAKPVDIEDANFWLRLELTDKALETYDTGWDLYVDLAPDQPQDSQVNLCTYITDSDSYQVKGWFIFGTASEKTKLDIKLRNAPDTISFQLEVAPIPLDSAKQDAKKLVTETLVYKIVSDETIKPLLDGALFNDHADEVYRKAVAENAYLAELETRYDANEYLLNWFSAGNGTQKMTAYALLSQDIFQSGLTEIQQQTYMRLEDSYTSLRKERAATYSTQNLLLYILNLEHLCKTLAGYYPHVEYAQLEEEFPALAVISQREDLISVLLQETYGYQFEKEAINWLLYYHRDRMTASEEAAYLLRQYPSGIFVEKPVSFSFPPQNSSTEEMIEALFLDSGLGTLLLTASNDEVREIIFSMATENIPIVSQIIAREDFIETMFSLADTDTISNYLMMLRAAMRLPFIQENMNAEQRQVYEERHTEFFILIYYSDVLDFPIGSAPVDP